MEYQTNASKQPTQYQYNFQIAKGFGNKTIISTLFKLINIKIMKIETIKCARCYSDLYYKISWSYHCSEESEVDPDGDSNETCIIIRDIEWRSDCLRMFLRDYLDVLFYQQIIDKKRRKRVFDDSRYALNEDIAPLNASQ
ncbi:hypothetical protein RclHR1_05860012 [Rhizophagus clarus]|uniref:Uncharacterized protein n=1 Tax=Rhizophagus clarus TaxID=94130 RepID=A0A2Z6RQ75_9GLOM|nr:hypothetical protein RclHR1_05860012 [Rhizophagus clarus]